MAGAARAGNQRDAQTGGDEPLLGRPAGHGDVGARHEPGPGSRGGQHGDVAPPTGLDPRLAGQRREVDRRFARQPVARRQGHQQRVVAQVGEIDALGRDHARRVVAHHRHIERPRPQRGDERAGQRLDHGGLHPRGRTAQLGQRRRHQHGVGRGERAHPQPPTGAPPQRGDLVRGDVEPGQDVDRVPVEHLAGRCEAHAAGPAREQRAAGRPLERGDAPRHARLGVVGGVGGGGERPESGDLAEHAQVLDLEGMPG